MKRLHFLPLVLISVILTSCAPTGSISSGGGKGHPSENAILWHQTSAEYKALCYQAFNVAQNRIEQTIGGATDMLVQDAMAVVMDLDETVLDNSPYSVKLMQEGKEYSESSWNDWVMRKEAGLVPGSAEFISFCLENNVEVFFISNRDISTLTPTMQNLQNLGIDATTDNLLLKDNNTKEERRSKLNGYAILLMVGDNLADFNAKYEDRLKLDKRDYYTESELRGEFGNQYIILPNTLYGDWMNALERSAKKREDQLNLLRSY